jgi:hypothetical protein
VSTTWPRIDAFLDSLAGIATDAIATDTATHSDPVLSEHPGP